MGNYSTLFYSIPSSRFYVQCTRSNGRLRRHGSDFMRCFRLSAEERWILWEFFVLRGERAAWVVLVGERGDVDA